MFNLLWGNCRPRMFTVGNVVCNSRKSWVRVPSSDLDRWRIATSVQWITWYYASIQVEPNCVTVFHLSSFFVYIMDFASGGKAHARFHTSSFSPVWQTAELSCQQCSNNLSYATVPTMRTIQTRPYFWLRDEQSHQISFSSLIMELTKSQMNKDTSYWFAPLWFAEFV